MVSQVSIYHQQIWFSIVTGWLISLYQCVWWLFYSYFTLCWWHDHNMEWAKAINDVKNFLGLQFKLRDLGALKYFLGIEVLSRHWNNTITKGSLHQSMQTYSWHSSRNKVTWCQTCKISHGTVFEAYSYWRWLTQRPNTLLTFGG